MTTKTYAGVGWGWGFCNLTQLGTAIHNICLFLDILKQHPVLIRRTSQQSSDNFLILCRYFKLYNPT
jgi:hypothetical protein